MLSGQNIVCFAPDPSWHHLWRNRHQIMTRLARKNRILFVEPTPYLRPVVADVRQQGLAVLRRSTFFSPMENLWVYRSPNLYPISGKTTLRQLTLALRQRHLRRTLARLDMAHPILWVFRYDLGEMVGRLDEKLVIYHAVDEYAGYALSSPGPQRHEHAQRILRMERKLLQQADLVFVTSPRLRESKLAWNRHIYVVPNGVDFLHFSRAPQQLPADILSSSPPRIGYAGAINEKIDIDLLEYIARQRPDWSLILVGPVLFKQPERLDALRAMPNVFFLGAKPVQDLPAYMHAFDVSLMPYAHNLWTENIDPLKLYEYLATGRPIVSTSIPAVQEFRDVVRIEDNREAFVLAIEQALEEDTVDMRRKRQDVARQHTWDQRIETLSSIIQGYLP